MTSPTISVVITTYNRPERIKKAIQTVLDQTYQDFEIIVVDGANSCKNHKEVLKFSVKDDRIKYVKVKSEAVNYVSYKGIQHSRNVGCRIARGKYIAMLDDDDTWDKTKLEKQLSYFNKGHESLALVLCYTKINMGNEIVIDKTILAPTYPILLQSFNLSSTSSYLIRRDVLQEICYWNEELRGMHEYDIALKLAKRNYLIFTYPEALMYRDRISNITVESGHYYYFKIAEILDLWKYYGKDFIKETGISGFSLNACKTVALCSLFLLGYLVKERIWNVVYPLKKIYEQIGVMS